MGFVKLFKPFLYVVVHRTQIRRDLSVFNQSAEVWRYLLRHIESQVTLGAFKAALLGSFFMDDAV